MLGVIKTAIITIVISFISGLLLDYYKNLAPRLLCHVGNAISMNLEGKKVFAYIVTVANVSNKIIHEITLDIQNKQNNLKIAETKITRGLKFNSSIKDKTLDVNIPFLSKGDKFSVTLYVEGQRAPLAKPVIILRSPEKFKRIESMEQRGLLFLLLNIPKNIVNAVSKPTEKGNYTKATNKEPYNYNNKALSDKKRKKTFKPDLNKKALIAMASIALIVVVGFSSRAFLKAKSNNSKTPEVNSTIQKEPTTNSTGGSTKTNSTTKSPSSNTIKNTNTTNSSYKNTGNGNSNSGSSSSKNSTENTGSNNSSSESTKNNKNNTENTNTTTNSSSGNNGENTNSNNSSSGDTTGNNNSANSSSGSTGESTPESN
jgi:hypothetical protein